MLAPRRLQHARETLDLALQPIPLALQPLAFPLQLVAVTLELLAFALQPRVVLTESFSVSAGLLDLTSQSLQFTLRVIARAQASGSPALVG